MAPFIDEHREQHGVEPICEMLPMAPSVYYEPNVRERPERRPTRAKRDEGVPLAGDLPPRQRDGRVGDRARGRGQWVTAPPNNDHNHPGKGRY